MTEIDLVDRYLQAVKPFVPAPRRDAILGELSETLRSQMRDREGALGRPLTEAEQVEILRGHGHPMVVANRYRANQQLIGPVFFPMYVFTLKLGLGVALIVTVVAAVIAAFVEPEPVRQFVDGLLGFPRRALMVIAWTTLGFAALDFAQRRLQLTYAWDPRLLPNAATGEYPVSRSGAFMGALFASAGVVWLLLLPWTPQLVLGPAAAYVEPGPIWRLAYVPILLVMIASATLDTAYVVRPYWTKTQSYARIALNAVSVAVLLMLLNAAAPFVPSPAAAWPQGVDASEVVRAINLGFRIGFLAWAVAALVEAIREVLRLKNRQCAELSTDSSPEPTPR